MGLKFAYYLSWRFDMLRQPRGNVSSESFDEVKFDLWPLLQGQTGVNHLKSACNFLIIDPRGLECIVTLQEIMSCESFDAVKFDLWPLHQGQTGVNHPKSAYNLLIIGPRGLECKVNL